MARKQYGVCGKCHKWGDAPPEFDERVHFLKCGNCGSPMYLDNNDPRQAGYPERDKVTVGTMPHKEAL